MVHGIDRVAALPPAICISVWVLHPALHSSAAMPFLLLLLDRVMPDPLLRSPLPQPNDLSQQIEQATTR
jgi:hypothetical protein